MAELTYAELTQGRESTRLPHTHKSTSLKIKFPFKRYVLPSHPSCSHLRQPIKLSFPEALRLIEMVPVLEKLKVLTQLNLLPLLSYVSL